MPAIDTTPSKVATTALQGIPFSSLIGGPLDAAVNAQIQSAKGTIDFIQNVGMTGPPDNRKAIQVEFIYYADGREAKLIVPLLTILPIPYLAVDSVDINFKASINASSSTYAETSTQEEAQAGGSAEASFGWGPVSAKASFDASYSSKKDSKATQESKYSVEYTMDLHVHAGQEDMPAGLAKVLNILGDSITPSANKPTIQVAPGTLVANDPTKGPQNLLVTAILFDEKAMRAAGKEIDVARSDNTPPTNIEVKFGEAETGKFTTDDDGTAEIQITISVKADAKGTTPAQRVKLKLTSSNPAASKIATLVIPEFTVPESEPGSGG
ncbi:DUF2589 domain-containing protein [Okeania sp. SIO2B9]|uniref:DUF2589 domain-containing protein n=1 Tax=Okeania sp. SIO2B9 TaxID=2607782 RepID=UPI001429E481|nr:DUF2589 domain-containing protein [Okeania sp. SIO2B9]NES90642.1 DUF2589 domain-containing protein [Okeania sp. SIO2B9]